LKPVANTSRLKTGIVWGRFQPVLAALSSDGLI
jgi:hypothetical protein